jgi:hypothetical protein
VTHKAFCVNFLFLVSDFFFLGKHFSIFYTKRFMGHSVAAVLLSYTTLYNDFIQQHSSNTVTHKAFCVNFLFLVSDFFFLESTFQFFTQNALWVTAALHEVAVRSHPISAECVLYFETSTTQQANELAGNDK